MYLLALLVICTGAVRDEVALGKRRWVFCQKLHCSANTFCSGYVSVSRPRFRMSKLELCLEALLIFFGGLGACLGTRAWTGPASCWSFPLSMQRRRRRRWARQEEGEGEPPHHMFCLHSASCLCTSQVREEMMRLLAEHSLPLGCSKYQCGWPARTMFVFSQRSALAAAAAAAAAMSEVMCTPESLVLALACIFHRGLNRGCLQK